MTFLIILVTAISLLGCKNTEIPPEPSNTKSPIVWKNAFEKEDLSSVPLYYNGLIITGHPSINEVYKVYAFEAETGDTVWQTSMNMLGVFDPRAEDELFLYKDKVVFSEAYDFGVIDANTGKIEWYKTVDDMDGGSCVIDDFLYKSQYDWNRKEISTLYRYNIYSGAEEKLFTIHKSEYGSNHSPNLMMPVKWIHPNGDEILVMQNRTFGWGTTGEDKMDVLAWNLTADSMLWYRDGLDERGSTSRPAIDGNKVYFFGTWHAYCIDAATGNTLWKYDVGVSIGGSFATANVLLVDDKLIVKQENERMHAADKETGERIWFTDKTASSPRYMTVRNDTIWHSSGGVQAIDANTGERLINWDNKGRGSWIFPVGLHPENGFIYTSDGSYLYCLDPRYMK